MVWNTLVSVPILGIIFLSLLIKQAVKTLNPINCFHPRIGDYFFIKKNYKKLKVALMSLGFRPRIGDYFFIFDRENKLVTVYAYPVSVPVLVIIFYRIHVLHLLA